MQQAYLLGSTEGLELGGQSTFFYADLDVPCDADRAASIVHEVLDRHDVFTASIEHDEAALRIDPQAARRHPGIDRPGTPEEADRLLAGARERLIAEGRASHETGRLYGATVVALPDGGSRICLYLSMLIADAVTGAVFLSEVRALLRGEQLPEPSRYADAVHRISARCSRRRLREDQEYWRTRAEELPPAPRFRADVALTDGWRTQRHERLLPQDTARAFLERARHDLTNPSVALLALHSAVISRWSNTPRFSINVTLTDRDRLPAELSAALMGDFTTSMVVDVDLREAGDIGRTVRVLGREMARSHRHRAWSGVELIREQLTDRTRGGRAALPVVFTSLIGDGRLAPGTGMGEGMDADHVYTQTSQVFLDMQAVPRDGSILLSWDVVPEYFGFDVEDMFEATCEAVGRYARGERVLPVVDPATERANSSYNSTSGTTGGQATLLDGVLSTCSRSPGRTALVNRALGLEYSYGDVDEMSARIADHLAAQGCEPGDVVAIETTKHPTSVINQIGVLRAGCAFLPVGAQLPAHRKEYMRQAAGARPLVLDDESYERHALARTPARGRPMPPPRPEDPAYVIFTSGSTGRPKGVVIPHRGAVNTISDINTRFGLTGADTIIGLSALTFDLSVYDIYGALSCGALLSLVNDERDADEILTVLREDRVSLWNSTPALLELTLLRATDEDSVDSLRALLLSGDRISFTLPRRSRQLFPRAQVFSLGGATEASIWSILHPLDGYDDPTAVPYGSPLSRQTIHILGHDLRLCPIGVPGEIWIGGDGLAAGYCGDPDQTAASFCEVEPFGRLYRTGDMGVFNSRGWVDFLGRRDRQVKVRGHRIELGEIEEVLSEDPSVGQVEVAVLDRPGGQQICAAVVASGPGATVDPDALRETARGFLPEYMVPARIVPVGSIPTTPNGKVDHRRLVELIGPPEEERETRGDEQGPAGDPGRAWMRELWSRVLGHEVLDDQVSFFAAGGDSLMFQALLREIRGATGQEVDFREIILDPTVRRFCELVDPAPDAGPAPTGRPGPGDDRAGQAEDPAPFDPFPSPRCRRPISRAGALTSIWEAAPSTTTWRSRRRSTRHGSRRPSTRPSGATPCCGRSCRRTGSASFPRSRGTGSSSTSSPSCRRTSAIRRSSGFVPG